MRLYPSLHAMAATDAARQLRDAVMVALLGRQLDGLLALHALMGDAPLIPPGRVALGFERGPLHFTTRKQVPHARAMLVAAISGPRLTACTMAASSGEVAP